MCRLFRNWRSISGDPSWQSRERFRVDAEGVLEPRMTGWSVVS
jgi:hypothetical protein